jgi:hypothetical protein
LDNITTPHSRLGPRFLHRFEHGGAPLRRVSVQGTQTGAPLLEMTSKKSLACGLLLPAARTIRAGRGS